MRTGLGVLIALCLLTVCLPSDFGEGSVIPSGTWTGMPTDPYSEDLNPYQVSSDLFWTEDFGSYDLGNRTDVAWVPDLIPEYPGDWRWVEKDNWELYDFDPGFLYWNATTKWTGTWGTSTTHFYLTNPVQEYDFYELTFHVRAIIYDGLPTQEIDSDLYVDFLTEWEHAVRVGIHYTAEDGTFVQDTWPEWGDYSELQTPWDGSVSPPYGMNLGGNCVNTQDTGSTQFDMQGAYSIGNGSYYTESGIAFHTFETNPYTGVPWTYDEICSLHGTVWLTWDRDIFDYASNLDYGFMMVLRTAYVVATPVEYEPEATPVGTFILRPDGDDDHIDNWNNASTDDQTDLWACLDETTFMSDGATTRIYFNPALGADNWVGFTLSDPPSWAADCNYQITLWSIMQSSDDSFMTWDEIVYRMYISPYGEAAQRTDGYSAHSFWFNETATSDSPGPGLNWTLESLRTLKIAFQSLITSGAYWNISQMAVLCIPTSEVIIDPEDADTDFITWLSSGGSIVGLIGVMGFIGLIAVPAIVAYNVREGNEDGFAGLIRAAILMTLFLGMFMAGIFAG